jgi:flagellar protein FliL
MAEAEPTKAEKPRSGATLWIIVGAVNVVLIGGGAFFVLSRSPSAEPAKKQEPAAAAPHAGPMLKLDPFIANLNEPDGNRYLKTTLALEMADEAAMQAADKHVTELRDSVLVYLSSLGVADTQGAEGKEAIRKELLGRARRAFGTEAVHGVFYSEFVLQ